MNFIISIFLVLFLSISSCQREATGDIVPTPAARYGEVDLTFGESGAALESTGWNHEGHQRTPR